FSDKDFSEDIAQWDFLDGILISGSGPDIPPSFYGKNKEIENNDWMVDERFLFEKALIKNQRTMPLPVWGSVADFRC
ncbi:peptidase C26, partial [mine drainage metagenome]